MMENMQEKYTTAADIATILRQKQMTANMTTSTLITIFLIRAFLAQGSYSDWAACWSGMIYSPYYFILLLQSYRKQFTHKTFTISILSYVFSTTGSDCHSLFEKGLNKVEQIKCLSDLYWTNIININRQRQMIGSDIRKMSLSYAKCPSGDLHTGEILSLVCVDAKCQKRGLICPICRMMNHEDHEVLPLKIFIQQVKKLFLQSEDAESLNNLSDYLRSIDHTKKQLLRILRQTAQNIAKQLKKVQQKIQENYVLIRKNILAQSTISTKLPIFIQKLLTKQENDAYWLQEQFQRYTQLIKFDKSVIQISDKAKKIAEGYSDQPKQIQQVLNDQTDKIKAGFKDLFSQKSSKQNKNTGYTFSSQNKHKQLKISDDKKQIYAPGTLQQYGLAYITENPGNSTRKITFKVVSASSTNIVLGMGLPKKDKQQGYLYNISIENQHFTINSDGYCQNENTPYDDNSLEDIPPGSFTFHYNDAEVSISLDQDKNQITFSKGEETKVLSISKLSEQDKKQLQFFVSLGENDRVKILDGKQG